MRLLVVEDERRMAELLRKGLEEEGYVVAVAFDGPTGLATARASSFELILLDIMLPGLDGFQVARQLRGEGVTTPILMLTARDATPDIVQGLDLGGDDYLTSRSRCCLPESGRFCAVAPHRPVCNSGSAPWSSTLPPTRSTGATSVSHLPEPSFTCSSF